MKKSKEYMAWNGMRNRCLCKTGKYYHRYGGRGITICPQWDDFSVFYRDMGIKPDGMSLDRINNNMGYTPDNCRWATYSQQNNNKRDNVWIEFNGDSKTLTQWSRILRISYAVLHKRINKYKWSHEMALSTPVRKMLSKSQWKAGSHRRPTHYC